MMQMILEYILVYQHPESLPSHLHKNHWLECARTYAWRSSVCMAIECTN